MKQPEQHSIGRLAERCFVKSLPSSWPARKQSEDDYGIDYEIEVFKPEGGSFESTGIIFKAQIKGTKKIQISTDGKIISFNLDIEKGRYLLEEIKIPAIFVICDVISDNCYWTELQSNHKILESYEKAKANSQNSFTIHIEVSSTVRKNHNKIVEAVARCISTLSLRQFTECSVLDFIDSAEFIDEDRLLEEIKVKKGALEYYKLEKYIASKDREGASKTVELLLKNPDTPVEIKFAATLVKVNLFVMIARNGDEERSGFYEKRQEIEQEALEIVKEGPPNLKALASALICASELQIKCFEDYHLYTNFLMQQQQPDIYWLLCIIHRRSVLVKEIINKFNECNKKLTNILEKRYYAAFPQAVGRICESINQLVLRMRIEGLNETAKKFVFWADNVLNMAKRIAKEYELWTLVSYLAYEKALFADIRDRNDIEKRFKLAEDWIESIPGDEVREKGRTKLLEVRQIVSNNKRLGQPLEIAEEQEYYRRQAQALGIRIDDSNNDTAKAVKIGIDDLNPERILKNCVYLFVRIVNVSDIGNMLNLLTVGNKEVKCIIHGHTMEGFSLDIIFKEFQGVYCSGCKNRKPHSKDWRWSREWQQEQNRKLNVSN